MSSWVLIPCLVALRTEFNRVNPKRDKGADGAIGDQSHTSSSDHTPDEDSNVLRDHDPDSKNEVHALDIDCSGPWPDGKGGQAGAWFDRKINAIVARERAEYHSADVYGRLQYVIWRDRIISRSWEWSEWRDYTGPSAHYDHAHFSARYLARTEADTRPWNVAEFTPAPTPPEEDTVSVQDVLDAFDRPEMGDKLAKLIKTRPALREALAWALLAYDPGKDASGNTPNGAVKNLTTDDPNNPTVGPATALERAQVAAVLGYQVRDLVTALRGDVAELKASLPPSGTTPPAAGK